MSLTIKTGSENYVAVIVKIPATYPIPKLDNLVGANVLGSDVLVQKNIDLEALHVLFVSGTKISADFLSHNNLYRDPTLNKDPQQKGYFEDNGRVKAIKFQGQVSTAVVMPLSSLDYILAGSNTKLSLGDTFTDIDGVQVCEKFVLVRDRGMSSKDNQGQSRKSLIDERQFPEHIDTSHLDKNLFKVEAGDKVAITIKTHGCLTSKTKIRTPDGKYVKIKDIKVGDKVLGYDFQKEQVVETDVLAIANGEKTDHWYRIQCKKIGMGDKPTIFATGNHKIYTNMGYVPAENLKVGDTVHILEKSEKLTDTQKSILISKFLGDGSINRTRGVKKLKKWSMTFAHKKEHEDYVDFTNYMLGENLAIQNKKEYKSGYGSKMLRSTTRQTKEIYNLFYDCFESGKKSIPKNLKLDKHILAFLYMDNGSMCHTEFQKDRANIAICDFIDGDITVLERALIEYGFVNFSLYKDKKQYWILRFNASDADFLWENICELVPPTMQYKIPEKYRGRFSLPQVELENKEFWYQEPSIIVDIEYIQKRKKLGFTKYDIETGTKNFFANKILVHNSSLRVAYQPIERELSWIEKVAKYFGARISDKKFAYVVGSRRVLKSYDFETVTKKQHYYATDLWSKVAKEFFEGKLLAYENVYAEIIGKTYDGGDIQKNYSYGYDRPHVQVYRISRVIDGVEIDYTHHQVKARCTQMGVEMVPELWYGEVDENFFEKVLPAINARVIDKPCYRDPKVPEEGYVVRVERFGTPLLLKKKSPTFLVYESKMLDEAITNPEDDGQSDDTL